MNKQEILDEIRRLAKASGGLAPGQRTFAAETGVRITDWRGRFWVRWNDAVKEAGCVPNTKRTAFSESFLVEQLIGLIRELGHFPVDAELRMKARSDPTFPDSTTFRRFGGKSQVVAKVRQFCLANPAFADVLTNFPPVPADREEACGPGSSREHYLGFVYLIKHGGRREYKIGRTNNTLRREGEIGVELPQEVKPLHVIKTDDPSGVEAYWHRRFADKRLKNEWFELTTEDVRAFKRWRRIC